MITEWHRYCETGNCIETRPVGDQVEIRDTERPEATLLVPAKAWEEFLASVRAEGWRAAAEALRDDKAYWDWMASRPPHASDNVRHRAADYLEALAAVRDDSKESR